MDAFPSSKLISHLATLLLTVNFPQLHDTWTGIGCDEPACKSRSWSTLSSAKFCFMYSMSATCRLVSHTGYYDRGAIVVYIKQCFCFMYNMTATCHLVAAVAGKPLIGSPSRLVEPIRGVPATECHQRHPHPQQQQQVH